MDSREGKTANGKIDSIDDNSELNNDPNNKQKRKRRSKNDGEGRSFKCSDCGKSYLSQPALTNHKKSKHNYGDNGEKKGRGRPRKNPPVPANIDTVERKFALFFEKEIRKVNLEAIDLEFAKECFKDIINKYNTLFNNLKTFDDHCFFKTMDSSWNILDETIIAKTDISCDDIFYLYLREVSKKTNKEYFHFLFKFVFLFRECINRLKKVDKPENEVDYTQTANAETVPDTCNEFITEFMDPNDYYGLDTSELIEAIQHFCYWLYVNHYTTSRLTLL